MNIFYKETIAIFTLFVVFFAVIVLFYSEQTPAPVYSLIYMTPLIVIAVMSYSLAKVYRKVPSFYYAYLLLFIAFTAHVIAEIIWLIMDVANLDGYQSYPDIFYGLYGIFLILHPWVIMKHFMIQPKRISYLFLIGCVIIGNLLYTYLSWDNLDSDSFLFGLAFVTLTNLLLGSTIVAIITLRGTKIFTIWILFCIAFVINATADIYYYASENFSDWTPGDLVNIAWFVAYIILIFTLIEHRYKYSVRNGR